MFGKTSRSAVSEERRRSITSTLKTFRFWFEPDEWPFEASFQFFRKRMANPATMIPITIADVPA